MPQLAEDLVQIRPTILISVPRIFERVYGRIKEKLKHEPAIARGLCMEPEALLFDEPTSALDPELVGDVLKVMRDLAEEGRTMVVVTHEMSFARDVSSQVVYLHQGLVEEAGKPEDVLGNPQSERLKQFLAPKY